MVFPVVMYRCESWTVNKTEHQRIDAFKLWCWKRHLRVPWTARRSNQSILKEISPEYDWCCSWNSNPSATWYEERTHWKRLMLGKIEGRRSGRQRMRRLNGITDSMDMSLSKLQEMLKDRKRGVLQSIGSQRVRHDLVTEQQQIQRITTHICIKHIQSKL